MNASFDRPPVGDTTRPTTEQKDAAKAALKDIPDVNGIGFCRVGDGWGFKVNLRAAPCVPVPDELCGFPVVAEVVGDIIPATTQPQPTDVPPGHCSRCGCRDEDCPCAEVGGSHADDLTEEGGL